MRFGLSPEARRRRPALVFGRDEKVSSFRLTGVQYFILGIFLVLAYGLWRLQVVSSEFYSALAEKNKTREVPILAPRGKILDRDGRVIVDNYPSFTALLLRDSTRDLSVDADLIAQGLHLDPKEVRERLHKFGATPQYQPIYLKEDITPDELAFIKSHRNELPELDTIMAHRRLYPRNGFMAHLIGYVGEVSEDMLNQPLWELYNPGDVVGKSGVELQYNQLLMGKNGSRQVLVNSKGKEVGELDEKPAVPGHSLKLTLDIDLQIAAEEAMGDKNGAMVAMDPHTGEILAMVSRPTFDPNDFAVRISRDEWKKLVNDPDKPLLNKAIQAQLAPGSTFKILMSVAGWQEGIAQTLNVHCNGGATFYGRRFGCWVKSGHGAVDLPRRFTSPVTFFSIPWRKNWASRASQNMPPPWDWVRRLESICLRKPAVSCRRKNGSFATSSRNGSREKPFQSVSDRVQLRLPVQLMRAISAISMDGRMVVPPRCQPDRSAIGLSRGPQLYGSKEHSYRRGRIRHHYGCDVASPAAGGYGAFSSHLRNRYRRENRVGADRFTAVRAKHASNAALNQNGWFVGFTPRRNPDDHRRSPV